MADNSLSAGAAMAITVLCIGIVAGTATTVASMGDVVMRQAVTTVDQISTNASENSFAAINQTLAPIPATHAYIEWEKNAHILSAIRSVSLSTFESVDPGAYTTSSPVFSNIARGAIFKDVEKDLIVTKKQKIGGVTQYDPQGFPKYESDTYGNYLFEAIPPGTGIIVESKEDLKALFAYQVMVKILQDPLTEEYIMIITEG